MLVLTRKSEQKILIGKDIVITILRVYGDQVSIGIDAPQEMRIFREELILRDPPNDTTVDPITQKFTMDSKGMARHRKDQKWRLHKGSQPVEIEEVL